MQMKTLLQLAKAVAVVGILTAGAVPSQLAAEDYQSRIRIGADAVVKQVKIGLNKSVAIDLPRNARDVMVSNPKVADAVMRTSRRAFIFGIAVGEANVFFFDEAGQQMAVLELQVARDLKVLQSTIRKMLPNANISVESIGESVALKGTAASPADAQRAADIAASFIGDNEKILNMVTAADKEQIMLRVTVAEVQRNLIKQLGIDLSGSFNAGSLASSVITNNPFSVAGSLVANNVATGTWTKGNDSISATVQALEQNGVVRILAEPNLSAVSGEAAEFLAGGEFPVPTSRDSDGNIVLEYKKFGIALAFTPVVMSEGRVSLKVNTEVSELTEEFSFQLAGLNVPGLKVRRASTTVELPSGGSVAIAGLIRDEYRQIINGVPALKDLPVLGTLFRSRDFQRKETELVIVVTPYTVRAVNREKLEDPGRNLEPPSDPQTVFLDRLNRIYGVGGGKGNGTYHGHIGFIVE
ncbi:MAG: type II and III secretion system protein family protein [Hyphomicrobiales bacterium]|nr:type II and III secretion system protein family protein [Hyphomicrobiales bacterium]